LTKKNKYPLLKLTHVHTITDSPCAWSLQLWFAMNPKFQIYNNLSNWTLIDDILFQLNHSHSLQLLSTTIIKYSSFLYSSQLVKRTVIWCNSSSAKFAEWPCKSLMPTSRTVNWKKFIQPFIEIYPATAMLRSTPQSRVNKNLNYSNVILSLLSVK
jgi:hypothetical protein